MPLVVVSSSQLGQACVLGFVSASAVPSSPRRHTYSTTPAPPSLWQVLWNPIFGCMFFGYMGAVDGMGPGAISDKIKNNLWTSVSTYIGVFRLFFFRAGCFVCRETVPRCPKYLPTPTPTFWLYRRTRYSCGHRFQIARGVWRIDMGVVARGNR